jgi:hypothetical protein
MYELLKLLFEHAFTPQAVQASGLSSGTAFNDFKRMANLYIKIGKDNPIQQETEELKRLIFRLRKLMTLFGGRLRAAKLNTEGASHEEVMRVIHAADPFIKEVYKMTQTSLIAYAGTLVNALSEPDIAEQAAQLELAQHLHLIKQLVERCNELLVFRGDEMERKKAIGSRSKNRRKLEASLQFLLYSVIPVLHSMSADNSPQKTALEEIIFHINAAFDVFHAK